jgi:hypothetical protein
LQEHGLALQILYTDDDTGECTPHRNAVGNVGRLLSRDL